MKAESVSAVVCANRFCKRKKKTKIEVNFFIDKYDLIVKMKKQGKKLHWSRGCTEGVICEILKDNAIGV